MILPSKGIVTVRNWVMCPDGERYLYLFSEHWQIVIDKKVPIEGFHSRERWSLVAIEGCEAVCVIPGCEVCGVIKTNKCPDKTAITPHKQDEPDISPGIFNLDEMKGYK